MKVVLELDKKLKDGELLIYKDGIIKSVEIHELLPELKKLKNSIKVTNDRINELAILVKEK